MGTRVFGIKIILQDKDNPVTENTGIGLYSVSGENSEFRWVQNSINGVTDWKDQVISLGGIKPFSNEIDLRRGGSVSFPGKGQVIVSNINNFASTISALGINLNGLRAEIWIFEGVTPRRIRVYNCEEPTWDSREYSIPLKGITRNANILYQDDVSGKAFNSTAVYNKLFLESIGGTITRTSICKFLRYQNEQDDTTYTNEYFNGTYPETKIFPVIGLTADDRTFLFELRETAAFTSKIPTDCYCVVSSGTGIDQIRKVVAFGASDHSYVICYLESYLITRLSATNDDTRSWVQFLYIDRNFIADSWQLKSFLNSGGDATVHPLVYLQNDEDSLDRVSDYGTIISGSGNNKLSIAGSQYGTSIDNLKSFVTLPVSNLALNTALTVSFDSEDYAKLTDGLYCLGLYEPNTSLISYDLSGLSAAHDRQKNTFAILNSTAHNNTVGQSARLLYVLNFDKPDISEINNIANIYIGVKLLTQNTNNYQQTFRVTMNRFAYGLAADTVETTDFTDGDNFDIENQLDRYWSNSPATTYDKNFNVNSRTTASGVTTITGHDFFELVGCTKNIYNTFVNGTLYLSCTADDTTLNFDAPLFDLSIILELSDLSMKSIVYSSVAGRIFSDTFAGRKTASDLIEKPQDILEHICRLQDYRDTCSAPVSGWGLQYASEPLVHTISFDLTDYSLYPAAQLSDYDAGYTDVIKQSLCREFSIANWQDSNGYEKIITLPTYALTPAHTVTMRDILDRNKIKIIKPKQTDIFPEPFVNYSKNAVTGEYEKQMTIINTAASVYNSSYVSGIDSSTDAQEIWQTCHSLALQVHQAGKPPNDLTDLQWANGAGGYSIALAHLRYWVNWQGLDEIEFPVHYNLAGSWQECTPVNLVFSHQTSNIVRSALVENCVINPNPPYDIMIRAVLYA